MPAWWRTRPAGGSDSIDIDCPRLDQFRHDVGCQVRCTDDNCTAGWAALHETRGTHLSFNCCPPYSGCIATAKQGTDPLASLPGDACERRCAAKLSTAFYKLELSRHTPLCQRTPAARRGNSSSLALIGEYLRVRNVAIDFGEATCVPGGRMRAFHAGFLTAACAPARGG